ncbi:DUF1097 family protein [Derxia gummosa]|uniref:DUF1097 family protein n=1 Tax=Derxia gummosa DSM 723 TaxID=1121388 RepID=A0A8B6X6L4_9BURK|nr:DUF1097 family protein [Derxia gummosa]
MKILHALALSIGALVAVWVFLSVGQPGLRFNPWIGFVAWAAFFAAGGGKGGFGKALAAGLAGIGLTAGALFIVAALGGGLAALIAVVALLAFVLVMMADLPLLSYTPAAFLGAAAFFGSGGKVDESVIFVALTWLVGLAFGFASEAAGKRIARPA